MEDNWTRSRGQVESLLDVYSRIVHDLDHYNEQHRPKSNLNRQAERLCATLYLLAVAMCMTLTLTFRVSKVKYKCANGKAMSDFSLFLATAMVATSITVCQKFTVETYMNLIMIFRMGQDQIKTANRKAHVLETAMFVLLSFARYLRVYNL